MNNLRKIVFKPSNFLASKFNAHPLRCFATKTINVPFMGDSISEGKIIELSKKPGEKVEVDDLVAVVETDKTSLEIRSPDSGVLTKFFHPVDTSVNVDSPLFELDTSPSTQAIKTQKKEEKSPEEVKTESVEAPKILVEKDNAEKTKTESVVKPPRTTPPNTKPPSCVEPNSSLRGERKIPLSRMRIKIAERLKESQNTAASLSTFNQIDCSKILKMRKEYKEQFQEITGSKLGLMSPFVKASTLALQKYPELNAYFDLEGQNIVMHDYVDVSVAVAGPKGLVVPVLRNTERMSFSDIENGIRKYALQAKEGKLKIDDMRGGTFTVSNSGVFKSLIGTPIINPPQAAVLGMYGIFDTPLAIEGEVKIRPVMKIALTYDHRVVDGREAVLFLRAVKEYIEDPITMLLH